MRDHSTDRGAAVLCDIEVNIRILNIYFHSIIKLYDWWFCLYFKDECSVSIIKYSEMGEIVLLENIVVL